jgi:hypothetical protein
MNKIRHDMHCTAWNLCRFTVSIVKVTID